MQDLMNSLNQNRKGLQKAIKIMKQRGIDKAKAEQEYRIALQQEMLRLKASGIAVTGIGDLARGETRVAGLKANRDISETLYETAKQQIYYLKIELSIAENLIKMEVKG